MNEEAKKIARKFTVLKIFFQVAFFVLYCLIFYFIYDFFNSFTVTVLIVLVASFFLLRVLNTLILVFFKKTVYSILVDEADADKYYSAIKSVKYLRRSLLYFASAAYFAGDYQTSVNIYTSVLKEVQPSLNNKLNILSNLASIYFELRDFEKLQAILDKIGEYRQLYPSHPFFKNPTGYYGLFLNGDYEACKNICRETEEKIPADHKNSLTKAQLCFLYAIACYENGEKEEARATFELILTNTPKLYWAEISKKYIESIENGSDLVISQEPIVPDGNMTLAAAKVPTKKKIVIRRVIYIALTALYLLYAYHLDQPPELTDDIVEVLSTRPAYDNGIGQKLEGDIYLSIFFVDDDESSWTSDEIEQYMKHQIRPGLDFLEEQAKEYGKSLTIHTKGYSTVPSKHSQQHDLIYDGTVKSGDAHTSMYEMLLYFDVRGVFIGDVDAPLGCAAILAVVDKEGVSYAYSERSEEKNLGPELAIVFTNYPGEHRDVDDNTEMAATVAHEVLHLFGAEDLYEPELLAEYAEYKYPRDIMLYEDNIKRAKIDKFTAYCIGWLDEAPEI